MTFSEAYIFLENKKDIVHSDFFPDQIFSH